MPSERLARCFADILGAVDLIESWVIEAGGADEAIFRDAKVRSAIERQLLIVSEAAIRLDKIDPMAAPRLAPSVDWAGVRGIGNFLRHRYDDLDTTILLDVIHNRLVALRGACLEAVDTLKDE